MYTKQLLRHPKFIPPPALLVITHDLWNVIISMAFDGPRAYGFCMNKALHHWRELGLESQMNEHERPVLYVHPLGLEGRMQRLKLLQQAHQLVHRYSDSVDTFRYTADALTINHLQPGKSDLRREEQREDERDQHSLEDKEEVQLPVSAPRQSLPLVQTMGGGVEPPRVQATHSHLSVSDATSLPSSLSCMWT